MIGKLADDIHEKNVIEGRKKAVGSCKAIFVDDEEDDSPESFYNQSSEEILLQDETKPSEAMPCQLPTKEDNMESFTLPCTIGNSNLSALANLDLVLMLCHSLYFCPLN